MESKNEKHKNHTSQPGGCQRQEMRTGEVVNGGKLPVTNPEDVVAEPPVFVFVFF